MNPEERLQTIEASLAHLEHLVEQLNEVVTQQAKTIQRLQHGQQRMASSMEQMELERIRGTNPKPPHY